MAFKLTNSQSHVLPHTHPTTDITGLDAAIQANAVVVSATAPSNPTKGKLWYNTTKGVFNIYDGSNWILVGPEITPITKAAYDALSSADKNDGRFYLITDNDGTIIVDWANVENKPDIPSAISELSGNSDNITEGSTHLFMTPSERTKLGNQSGTNTGDQSASDFDIKDLADSTGLRTTWNNKQNAITDLDTIRAGASAGATALQSGDNISELVNDEGYIKASVNNLENYYTKTETYTKEEVDAIIADFGGFEVVEELPTEDIRTNIIYLKGPIGTGGDKYEQWIYSNEEWTLIGETSVDLSNYFNTFTDTSDSIPEGTTKLFVSPTEKSTWNAKQDAISDLQTIRDNATAGAGAATTIATYGDIVTHDVDEFATAAQGAKADTALQPNDNVSELTNDAGYITNAALSGLATETYVNNTVDGLASETYVNTAVSGLASEDYVDQSVEGLASEDYVDQSIEGLASETYVQNAVNTAVAGLATEDYVDQQDALKQDKFFTKGTTAPTNPSEGDQWYDSTNDVMKFYDGTEWKTIDTDTDVNAQWGNITGTLSEQTDLQNALNARQETLVSGTNIKTINDTSLLGEGNIEISPGKYDIISSSTAPSDYDVLWYDTTSGEMKAYEPFSSVWSSITSIVKSSSRPTDDKLWLNTSSGELKAYESSSNTWSPIINTVESYDEPSSRKLWYKIGEGGDTDKLLYFDYDARTWVPVGGIVESYNEPYTTRKLWYKIGEGGDTDKLLYFDADSGEWKPLGDTTYTAGTGLTLTGTEFSADTTVLATKEDLANFGSFEVVEELPSADTANSKTIYLKGPIGTGEDKYEEWIYSNEEWTLIGETSIDLSGYATTSEVNTALGGKQNVLTAGEGITINENNVISATSKEYTAGYGVKIEEDEISVDTDVIQEKLTAGEGISITGGEVCTVESDRKGPAPSGFHVPSGEEWRGVKGIMDGLELIQGDNWKVNLHMPYAGLRSQYTADVNFRGGAAHYWSSSPGTHNGEADFLYLASDISAFDNAACGVGFSIRCFKNEFVAPTSSWTVVRGTLGGSGIFWNQSEGLISITDENTTGYTMMDKNLGATEVYNDGDELTQANMGNMYQWGNNYGFPSTGELPNISDTKVDASGYGPGNYYESSTYIAGYNISEWDSSYNNNLWGNTSNGTHEECVDGNTLTISSNIDLSTKQDKATSGSTAPSVVPTYIGQQYVDTTNGKLYVAKGTEAVTDWIEVGSGSGGGNVIALTQAEYDALSDEEKDNGTIYFITDVEGNVIDTTGGGGGGGNVIAMTQAEYDALSAEEKNDGKLRIITDAPTEDISVDWNNVANKPIELSTQAGNTLTSLKIWVGSQSDYEALGTYDASTLYFTTKVVS